MDHWRTFEPLWDSFGSWIYFQGLSKDFQGSLKYFLTFTGHFGLIHFAATQDLFKTLNPSVVNVSQFESSDWLQPDVVQPIRAFGPQRAPYLNDCLCLGLDQRRCHVSAGSLSFSHFGVAAATFSLNTPKNGCYYLSCLFSIYFSSFTVKTARFPAVFEAVES